MEPQIQYAKTEDGVSIAFWTLGEGMPIVYMPPLTLSHVQAEWQWPVFRQWCERLAQERRVIRYDGRGCGLTDRQVAIAYAARRPERVSHLVLWCSWARGSDAYTSPVMQSIRGIREYDWETYTETVAHIGVGWSGGEDARRYATLLRESVSPEAWQAMARAMSEFDVSGLLSEVRCPTLVLHRRQVRLPDVSFARGLASAIPDARLVLLEGPSFAPFVDDTDSVLLAIDEFLSEGEEAAAPALGQEDIHTILFTDVEESTALTDRLGDAKARDVLRTHEGIVRDALHAHGGSEVKTMGDGFMASFSSATKALECAIAMQRAFEEHNESAEEPIRVRVGLNAGEPIAEEEDLFGTAVIRAARIAALAAGGEILVANVVRELSEGKGFLFADRGDTALRGFEDPVRLFEVRWREEGGG
jgi:class 3 adenylate cyclase